MRASAFDLRVQSTVMLYVLAAPRALRRRLFLAIEVADAHARPAETDAGCRLTVSFLQPLDLWFLIRLLLLRLISAFRTQRPLHRLAVPFFTAS